MRILFLGNPYFVGELEELGHRVEVCSYRDRGRVIIPALPIAIEEILEQLRPSFEPDAIILGDESIHPIFVGLESLDIPVGWVAVDSHIHMAWHRDYAAAFDVIDVAQESYVDGYRFDRARQLVRWAPLFAKDELLVERELERDLDVSFVGTLNEEINPARVELIEDLRSRVPLHVTSGDFVDVFHRSKMILNQCLNDDVNFRTFEAMACGGMLLMERVGNGLSELFEEGKHFVAYDRGDVDGLVKTIEYYLAHPGECAEIARAGRQEVSTKHRAMHRAKAWVSVLESPEVRQRVKQRLSARGDVEASVARAYRAAADDYGRAGIDVMHRGYVTLIEGFSK